MHALQYPSHLGTSCRNENFVPINSLNTLKYNNYTLKKMECIFKIKHFSFYLCILLITHSIKNGHESMVPHLATCKYVWYVWSIKTIFNNPDTLLHILTHTVKIAIHKRRCVCCAFRCLCVPVSVGCYTGHFTGRVILGGQPTAQSLHFHYRCPWTAIQGEPHFL